MARKTKVARRATKPVVDAGDRIKGSVLAALLTSTEFQERLQAAQQQCRDEWQALTGEPQPETCDEWTVAAREFGLPPDVAFHGNFTENDVALAMRGEMKRHRRKMAEAQAQVPAATLEPTGFMSVSELAQAFGIGRDYFDAFKQRLTRDRMKLGDDAWEEIHIRNRRPNDPMFRYDAGHPRVRELAAKYTE